MLQPQVIIQQAMMIMMMMMMMMMMMINGIDRVITESYSPFNYKVNR